MMIFQGVIIFKTLDTYAKWSSNGGYQFRGIWVYLTVSCQLDKTEFGLVSQTTVGLITDIFLNCMSHLQKSNYVPIWQALKHPTISSSVGFNNQCFKPQLGIGVTESFGAGSWDNRGVGGVGVERGGVLASVCNRYWFLLGLTQED